MLEPVRGDSIAVDLSIRMLFSRKLVCSLQFLDNSQNSDVKTGSKQPLHSRDGGKSVLRQLLDAVIKEKDHSVNE